MSESVLAAGFFQPRWQRRSMLYRVECQSVMIARDNIDTLVLSDRSRFLRQIIPSDIDLISRGLLSPGAASDKVARTVSCEGLGFCIQHEPTNGI